MGMGIWGVGFWFEGNTCSGLESRDISCYHYFTYHAENWKITDDSSMPNPFENNIPDWMYGAEAASCLAVIFGLLTVLLGFLGKYIPAAIFSTLTCIVSIVPFALWENKVLGAKGWRSLQKHGVAKAYLVCRPLLEK